MVAGRTKLYFERVSESRIRPSLEKLSHANHPSGRRIATPTGISEHHSSAQINGNSSTFDSFPKANQMLG